MASTKRTNTVVSNAAKDLTVKQIENLLMQLKQKLEQYKKQHNGAEYGIILLEGDRNEPEAEPETPQYDYVNPQHYVQDDGRQTWERMVDKWGEEKTALWCEMTAFKYQDRMGKKPGEDVEREKGKIEWYEKKAQELKDKIEKRRFW
jgi:hypothetical protein